MKRDGVKYHSTVMDLAVPLKIFWQRFSLFLLIASSIVIIIFNKVDASISETVRTKAADFIAPITQFITQPIDATLHFYNNIGTYFDVREDNLRLTQENAWLKRQIMAQKQIAIENSHLRELLHVVRKPSISYITARVVGDTTGPYVRSILINAGKNYGIQKGQAVINNHGLIGRITEVGEQTSRILLLTDMSSKVPIITNSSRERGILAGNGSETPSVLYLPEKSSIIEGETVITSGDGELFPPGLLVGTISTEEGRAIIFPSVNYNRLEFVSIINY